MRKLLKIIAIAFLVLMAIQPKIGATDPIFDIVLCSDTIRFNKGESFEIIIYFIGLGEVTEDYLLFYVNDEIYVKESYIMGGKVVEGLQDRGTNMQRIDNLMPLVKPFFIDYSPDNLNPLHSGMIKEGRFIPPMNVTLITGDNVSSGEHTIETVYMYKGEDDVWYQASDVMNFHVTTEAEEIEYETLKLSFTEPYLAAFLGLLSALFIYGLTLFITKGKEKKRITEMEKKLLLMIEDEIKFNLDKVQQIKNESRENVIPNYRAKTDNKEACWTNIIKYRREKPDLIDDISKLYFKYDFLNRTIDTDVQFTSNNIPIKDMFKEIKRICREIENSSEKLLKKLKSM